MYFFGPVKNRHGPYKPLNSENLPHEKKNISEQISKLVVVEVEIPTLLANGGNVSRTRSYRQTLHRYKCTYIQVHTRKRINVNKHIQVPKVHTNAYSPERWTDGNERESSGKKAETRRRKEKRGEGGQRIERDTYAASIWFHSASVKTGRRGCFLVTWLLSQVNTRYRPSQPRTGHFSGTCNQYV